MGVQASTLINPKVSLVWLLNASSKKRKEKRNENETTSSDLITKLSSTSVPALIAPPRPISPIQRRQRRSKSPRHLHHHHRRHQRFGYHISHLDNFLSKASLECPANIPMVLSRHCLLYQTERGRPQEERPLPLGMVVNAVFKNRDWLYVQTPHGQEGYLDYSAALPLGILPPPADDKSQPVWESASDVFPKPHGRPNSRCRDEFGTRSECGSSVLATECGEESVDSLYLAATSRRNATHSQILLVISEDYEGQGIIVYKGDVVRLVGRQTSGDHQEDLFWVRDRRGREGAIPSSVAGHGFL